MDTRNDPSTTSCPALPQGAGAASQEPTEATCSPLLEPRHFPDREVRLGPAGFQYEEFIDDEVREMEMPSSATQGFRRRLLNRPRTRILVNPAHLAIADLFATLKADQARTCPDEPIELGHDAPEAYHLRWDTWLEDEKRCEGQLLHVVAFDREALAGYAALHTCVARANESEGLEIELQVDARFVYVPPSKRKRGFGFDLSVACGRIARLLVNAMHRAAPANSRLSATISADYDSSGGEAFTEQIFQCTEFGLGLLRDRSGRRKIAIGGVELDAGY